MSPNPLVNALLLLLLGVVAGAIAFAVRRFLPDRSSLDTGPYSATLSYVATAYGVIVAFMIVFLFGAFSDARFSVGDEATSIGTAFEELRTFGADGVPAQEALLCYAQTATEYDWPAMRNGASAPEVDRAYSEVIMALGAIDAPNGTTFEPAMATNIMVQVGSISTAREARLVTAETTVPVLMWGLLLGGGLLVLVLIFVVTLPAPGRTQSVLVGLSATFTGALLILLLALANPYAKGAGRVSPELIEQTAATMSQELPSAPTTPCPPPA